MGMESPFSSAMGEVGVTDDDMPKNELLHCGAVW